MHLFRCEGSDLAPVAKHCDAIRDREDLIESMRDVEDAETPFGNTTDGGEENLDLHAREGCRRLVEDENLGARLPVPEGTRNGDTRALGLREVAYWSADIEIEAELAHHRCCLAPLVPPANSTAEACREPASKTQVLNDTEVVDESNGPGERNENLRRARGRGMTERHGRSFDLDDRAVFGVMEPRKQLDERRLPRAVLPDECVNLSGSDLERHVAQGARSTKRLHIRWSATSGVLLVEGI